MCKGLGLDLCEVSRMEKFLKDDRFLSRFFTPEEALYVRSRGVGAASTLAGLFAAREALSKALGSGLDFDLKEAEVCHTADGAPYFRLSGRLKQRLAGCTPHLSISHDGGIAAAVVYLDIPDHSSGN